MADYTQARRLMALSTPLGEDALLLTSLRGQARLSELFRFDLELLAENATRVDFGALLGQEVTARVTPFPDTPRYFSGIVTKLVKGKRTQHFTQYRAVVMPRLWLLTQNVQSRVFQHLSVPDILRQVLAKVLTADQFTFSNLHGDYQKRDYCVQYRESDFAFLSRLMEEEGITYYFRHSQSGHQLVITDTPFDKLDPTEAKLTYEEVEGGTRTQPRITSWEVQHQVRPRRYVLRDHAFELPDQDLEEAQSVQPSVRVGTIEHQLTWGNQDLEIYDHPGGYAERFDSVGSGGDDRPEELQKIFTDAKRTVRLRMEAETTQAIRIDGESTAAAFHPGYHFELAHHHDGDGAYLISEVEHVAQLFGLCSGEELRVDYHNRFSCVPRGLPYRPPRRTPRPFVGTQTAVVVGPVGQEAFIDKYGRVKVQFHWDRRGKKNADSSCWVRVAQIWAGKGWGAFFWPRIGQEVVVSFEEGDPDRPLIVGSVYNDRNRPPFFPAEPLVNGIRSCSSFGQASSESNGLLFHDERGREHLQIHSERDEIFHTESDKHVQVGQNLVTIVGGFGAGRDGDGSGSGAGDDGDDSKSPVFFESEVPARLGMTVQAAFGAQVNFVSFYQANYVVGHTISWVVNPTALLTSRLHALDGPNPPSGPWGWIAGLGGQQMFVLGTQTNLQYGPAINIQRGPALVYAGELGIKDGLMAAGIGAVGMAAALLSGKEFGLPGAYGTPTNKAVLGVGGTALSVFITALWTGLETKLAVVEAAAQKAGEAQEMLNHVVFQQDLTRLANQATRTAVKESTQALGLIAQGAGGQGDDDRWFNCNGHYHQTAHDISFMSSHRANPLTQDPGGPSLISLTAVGSGDNGNIFLSASDMVHVFGRNGMLVGGEGMMAGSAVQLQAKHGLPNPLSVGSQVKLHQDGIDIAVGVQSPLRQGPRILLTGQDITLAAGSPVTGSSIKLTSDSIELNTGGWKMLMSSGGIRMLVGDSRLYVKPEGLTLEGFSILQKTDIYQADVRLMLTEKVGGVLKREAGMETWF